MKKISHYCATAALAAGLMGVGIQAGSAAKYMIEDNGVAAPSSSLSTQTTPKLGNLVYDQIEQNNQQANEIKVAGRRTGRYIALGLGAAILGSALTAHHYNRGYYYGRPYRTYYYPRRYRYRGYYRSSSYYAPAWVKRKCARRFKSFDWYSGTYVTYSGRVRLCPYL